jgi:signal transduction histidine kinase
MVLLGSLTNRIFLASALLAALSIGAALFFVRARLTTETQEALDRDLQTAANIVDQQQQALFENFTTSARLLADLPRFKAAVDTGHGPTVQPIAEDYQQQLGSDFLQVRNSRGDLLATVGGEDAGVLRVVDVPILLDRERLGTLTVGYLLDETRAISLSRATGAAVAFAVDGRVQASSLGAESYATLEDLTPDQGQATVRIGGAEYVALVRPLPPAAEGHSVPSVVVMHSRTERMRTLGEIQAFLLSLALVSVLLAVAFSYWVARTITRPLARITDHMHELMASGDLTRKITLTGPRGLYDEDAQVLAGTFNSLTDAIARFQREAAQRDRLSALGRLSTVIAHEVRNPLMIIKGALRTLTRPGAAPEDVRDAAGDIDEEIGRLNHLVNDVLDFARPIRVEPAPADINAVCEDAVRAVSTNGASRVALNLAPHLAPVVTDHERLRTVLVNLLANAQQAVDQAGHAELPGAIELETRPHPAGGVAIMVRDMGAGIPAEDLPHIFDPYFTTRRGGTGLGLAITRNIVDGLGGNVSVTSRSGRGTEFRVEIGPGATRASRTS